MTRHLSDNEIDQYRRRTIAPDQMIAANEHLSQCEDCYRRFNPTPDVRRVYASFRKALVLDEASLADHLTYEELSGHVNGTLNGNEADRCWAHIEMCAECREDVEDLREFKAGAYPREQSPAKPTVQSGALRASGPTLLQAGWLARPFGLGVLAASVLIVAVGAGWLVTSGLRREITSLRARIGQIQSENESLRQEASEMEYLRNRIAELGGSVTPEASSNAASSPVVAALKDGNGVVQLHKDGGLSGLESAPEDLRDAVRLALRTLRLEKPRLESLRGKPDVLMGDGHPDVLFSVKSPVGIVVEEARPVFEWSPAEGAISYRVTITDARSGRMLSSPQVSESQWQSSEPLPRGRTYSWAVTAQVGNGRDVVAPAPPAPVAQFKIISSDEENKLREARRLVPRSHLLEAVLYAKAGLMPEARRELQALVEANPQSHLASRLLEQARDGNARDRAP